MRSQKVWVEMEHWDVLAKYYNDNHEEIRMKGFRNFGHWLGSLIYKGFLKTYVIIPALKDGEIE